MTGPKTLEHWQPRWLGISSWTEDGKRRRTVTACPLPYVMAAKADDCFFSLGGYGILMQCDRSFADGARRIMDLMNDESRRLFSERVAVAYRLSHGYESLEERDSMERYIDRLREWMDLLGCIRDEAAQLLLEATDGQLREQE